MTKRTGRRGGIITRRGGLLTADVVPGPTYPGEAEARAGSGFGVRREGSSFGKSGHRWYPLCADRRW